MKDKISVIIPCYNAGKHIDRCLKSIEDQTYGIDNMEIILVDDVSFTRQKEEEGFLLTTNIKMFMM